MPTPALVFGIVTRAPLAYVPAPNSCPLVRDACTWYRPAYTREVPVLAPARLESNPFRSIDVNKGLQWCFDAHKSAQKVLYGSSGAMRRTAPPGSDVRSGEGAVMAHPTAKDSPEPTDGAVAPAATAVTSGGTRGPRNARRRGRRARAPYKTRPRCRGFMHGGDDPRDRRHAPTSEPGAVLGCHVSAARCRVGRARGTEGRPATRRAGAGAPDAVGVEGAAPEDRP